ncbi:MAG: carboxypeptidase-like regulatory domain-containing protein [Verrucomicrobiae bacterium]|nr:carboxypeptidase-like regulatory domain-containing protein [Verrucomicrobiae bacterium]
MNRKMSHVLAGLTSVALLLAGCATSGPVEQKPEDALRLSVAPSASSSDVLVGRVVDASGKPIVAAKVRCWGDDPKRAKTVETNSQGYFSTERLLPGRWHVRAEHAGYAPAHMIEFSVGSRRPLPVILFHLHRGGSLKVRVVDGQKSPIRNARVMVLGPDELLASLRDSGQGVYESEFALPEGELSLNVIAPGFAPADQKVFIKAGESQTAEVTLVLPSGWSPRPAAPK